MSHSKAEMLVHLRAHNFPVPPLTYFSVKSWRERPHICLAEMTAVGASLLAVRSSSLCEDGLESSLAGAFKSVLNVPVNSQADLTAAVEEVLESLSSPADQIIAQAMVHQADMSGVLMTRTLGDGSPYYVINYDDCSGRTDLVTSGRGTGKTVYVYRGVKDSDFDSPRLAELVRLAKDLENFLDGIPLDIEFAVDINQQVHLLQVRRICTDRHWSAAAVVVGRLEKHINNVASFVDQIMDRRQGLYGSKSVLGIMPDWNPAEMIGVHPKPLAISLYRRLITRDVWREARAAMGYGKLPPVELMVSLAGRPYIDVRASFNSFLPENLPPSVSERLVAAWLERLDQNPAFHDKVEFEIVPTVLTPTFADDFRKRYGGLLSESELTEYRVRLADLTNRAMTPGDTLDMALADIERLRHSQETFVAERSTAAQQGRFDLTLRILELLMECRALGTKPFAIIARHGFIAESWLRSLENASILNQERVSALKRSIVTISGQLTHEFNQVLDNVLSKHDFLNRYGHLRPSAYDIMSPSYAERSDLFSVAPSSREYHQPQPFTFTEDEKNGLAEALKNSGLRATPDSFLDYVHRSVAGREYAKFIFTRHVDQILRLVKMWGGTLGFSPEDMSFMSIDDLLTVAFQPLPLTGEDYFRHVVENGRKEYELGRAFKLSYLIRSPRDVFIVPQHRSEPNFIGSKTVTAPVAVLSPETENLDMRGSIVCIESADPGYDWIFTRQIAGLITRYGGTNSHMAIRCAEYGLPAAIGCGDKIYETAAGVEMLTLDCAAKSIRPVSPSSSLAQG